MVNNLPSNAGDAGKVGWIPGSGRFPEGVNGNPLQYSCMENPMDGGAWLATICGAAKSRTRLSDFTFLSCGLQEDSSDSICKAARDTDVKNRLSDSVGEGEDGMI